MTRESDSPRSTDVSLKERPPFNDLAELVSTCISLMNSGSMSRLDVEYGELRLSLRSNGEAAPSPTSRLRLRTLEGQESPEDTSIETDGGHVVTAPMIGTFYASPAPGDPPFVSPGDEIEVGQTVGIIEAMKIMNEIASDRAGTVLEIIAINAQSVEFGSPLVRIAPSVS